MTSDVKYSWLKANIQKPNKLKKVMNRYKKREYQLRTILDTSRIYGIELSEDVITQIISKITFYSWQYGKIFNYLNNNELNIEDIYFKHPIELVIKSHIQNRIEVYKKYKFCY